MTIKTLRQIREEAGSPSIPFEHNPKIGWWADHPSHLTVYHGTHDDNVHNIVKNGLTHKDPRTGMISVTHDPHTAHGYASMSKSGGEYHFRKVGGNPVSTPHEHRSVVKIQIPKDWAAKHIDPHLHGNIGQAANKMKDKAAYETWKKKNPDKPDHEYYQTTELRMNKEIPPHFIKGVMKKIPKETQKPIETRVKKKDPRDLT